MKNNLPYISVIIPCYNEVGTITVIIDKIRNLKGLNIQIIVVDDGSNDGSLYLIKKIIKKIDKLIIHKKNLGKGAAIKSALNFIRGDIVIIQDADLEYDPKDYYKLIRPIINFNCKVVYGSRALTKNRYFNSRNGFLSYYRILGNHILTLISNFINKQNLTDAHTCYKVFHKSVLRDLNLVENDFSFCPEVTTKISNKNIKIYEVPIRYVGRSVSEGKKIGLRDAFKAVYVLFYYKFIN
jgi:dolichol-phosphate mannosyltransferase